jgi:putative transposase
LISEIDLEPYGGQTMTVSKLKAKKASVEALVSGDRDLMKALLKEALQEVLAAEMTEFLGAGPGERSEERTGYRAGYYRRDLITRIGKLELRVPRDRNGEFSTGLFERYQRSEKALVAALAEMYVQGVSTRKVKLITEELCGHRFSASAISAINKRLGCVNTNQSSYEILRGWKSPKRSTA